MSRESLIDCRPRASQDSPGGDADVEQPVGLEVGDEEQVLPPLAGAVPQVRPDVQVCRGPIGHEWARDQVELHDDIDKISVLECYSDDYVGSIEIDEKR